MLIKSLCDYYDILAEDGKLTAEGYSSVKVSYAVELNCDGSIADIFDIRDVNEKNKKNPRNEIFPKRIETTKIEANIAEHRPLYIFGLEADKEGYKVSKKSKNSHDAFVSVSNEFFSEIDNPLVNAFKAFAEIWKPEENLEHPALMKILKEYGKSNFVFCLKDEPENFLHKNEAVKAVWEEKFSKKSENGTESVCSVLGEKGQLAVIHAKIKGIAGANSTGAVLCCNKNPAECSYGCAQGANSSMSDKAMQKYTASLNYLLSDKSHRKLIDDMTVVFWSVGSTSEIDELEDYALFGSDEDREELDRSLLSLMDTAEQGKTVSDNLKGLDKGEFYMLGVKPNVSRVSVKFFYRSRAADLINNIIRHQLDLKIGRKFKPMPLWKIKAALKNNNSKQNIHSSLLVSLFKSVIYGSSYPLFILENAVRRIQAERSIGTDRASVIKAYLNRLYRLRGKEEVLSVELDEKNVNPAFICGRLFAVLEYIQSSAAGKLNRTIKDAYFTAAAVTPANVFPKLIQLAEHHVKVIERSSESRSRYLWKLLSCITAELGAGSFPKRLNLEQQGIFYVGYFQQNNKLYEKKEN